MFVLVAVEGGRTCAADVFDVAGGTSNEIVMRCPSILIEGMEGRERC
jgi:hypothetical protein